MGNWQRGELVITEGREINQDKSHFYRQEGMAVIKGLLCKAFQKTMIKILRYFDISDADIQSALDNTDFSSDYNNLRFIVKVTNELKEYHIIFKAQATDSEG